MIKEKILKLKDKKLLLSIIINIFICVLYLVVYKPVYEDNDDNLIASLLSGFYGENESHLFFINYIVGAFLKPLYGINQNIPWYDCYQCFICFLAMVAITYCLLKMIKSNNSIILIVLLDLFIGYEVFVKVQFTKTAGFTIYAGMLIIMLFTLFEEKRSYLKAALGVVLATFGFMHRQESLFITLGTASMMFIYFILNKKLSKKLFTKKILPCAIVFSILLVCIATVNVVDNSIYVRDGWDFDRSKWTNDLARIIDYSNLEFDEDGLKNTGTNVDSETKEIILRWNVYDPDYFTKENLDILKNNVIKPQKTLLEFFRKAFVRLILGQYVPFYIFMVAMVLMLIRNKFIKADYLKLLYIVSVILSMYVAMYYIGRVFINRVDCVIWYTSLVPLILMINPSKEIIGIRKNLIVFVSLFTLLQSFHKSEWRYYYKEQLFETSSKKVLQLINSDKEHLYLSTVFGVSPMTYTVFDNIPYQTGDNLFTIGGWGSYMPSNYNRLKKYDVKNPYSDVVDNERVYLIDENIGSTMKYINKHYNSMARAVLYKKIEDIKIYKIVT